MSDVSEYTTLVAYIGTFSLAHIEPCPETGGICVHTRPENDRVPIMLGPRNGNGMF